MKAIPYSRACLDSQTFLRKKLLVSLALEAFRNKFNVVASPINFFKSRNCTSPNLRNMKSFTCSNFVGSFSLSHIRYGIK